MANEIRHEIRLLMSRWRRQWIFIFLAAQTYPLVEMAFIGCVYFFISPAGSKEVEWFRRGGEFFGIDAIALPWSIFGLSLAFLAVFILLRYAYEKSLIAILYTVFQWDTSRLVERYLYTSVDRSRALGKERITSCIMNDCASVAVLCRHGQTLLASLISAAIYLAGAIFLSWQMLLVSAAIFSIPLFLNRKSYRKMEDIGTLKVKTQEKVLGFFTDILNGFERMKLDALEASIEDESRKVIKKSQAWRIQKRITQAQLNISMDGMSLLGLLLVLFSGRVMLNLELATLMILFVIFNRLKTYVTLASRSIVGIRSILPHTRRLVELLKWFEVGENKVAEWRGAQPMDFSKINIEGVSFSYDQDLVLRDVSFEAERGDRILIQGSSGSGKSTLLDIMTGIFTPTDGSVLFDGKELDASLFFRIRSNVVMVSPTLYLFRGTIRKNLVVDESFSDADIDHAVAMSGLSEVLPQLPAGLETNIGTDGENLSLGQRQRVILARIYLRKPRLVLLDEATANLDTELENRVIQNLQESLDPDCIVIMVAHKVPSGMDFNKTFTMNRGVLEPLPVTTR